MAKAEDFNAYKTAEKKALEILAEMKAVSGNDVDIELALLVAIFELHKANMSGETVAKIIQEHMKTLLSHYGVQNKPSA